MPSTEQPETTVVLHSAITTVQTDATELATLITKFSSAHNAHFNDKDQTHWDKVRARAAKLQASVLALTADPVPIPPGAQGEL